MLFAGRIGKPESDVSRSLAGLALVGSVAGGKAGRRIELQKRVTIAMRRCRMPWYLEPYQDANGDEHDCPTRREG